ncbi:acyl-CoA thioesterase [Sphingomonas sp. TZW2008]|uniref:acyl-CoA thioesterase n=1 Tax=Sphingomonas sp. TZW2008 TaxID=1917973 RepID=UPI000A2727E7|nr:acyl-CoA thioesterase [Sphingomonas sp. TZW2008]
MDTLPNPPGGAHLRTVAMPRDANPSGNIFGGWTLSQMDLAGGMFAVERAAGPVATVAIDAMRFLRPISIRDEVSCFCSWEDEGSTSIKVKVETWTRVRGTKQAEKVTEGVFTYVALTDQGEPRDLNDKAD